MYIMSLFYIYNYYVFSNKTFYLSFSLYNVFYDISFMTFKELITLYLHTFVFFKSHNSIYKRFKSYLIANRK